MGHLKHELAKERVGPGKPRPRIVGRTICIEGLMHEPRSRVGSGKKAKALRDLELAVAGEPPHDD